MVPQAVYTSNTCVRDMMHDTNQERFDRSILDLSRSVTQQQSCTFFKPNMLLPAHWLPEALDGSSLKCWPDKKRPAGEAKPIPNAVSVVADLVQRMVV